MSLPYSDATAGKRAIDEIDKLLRAFGCSSFGHMMDYSNGDLLVQFEHRGRKVSVKASSTGYAAAWLREHPYGPRIKVSKAAHEARARKIGDIAVYSILRDWVKGQLTAIECGVLSFEGAFLGQILLPNGKTVLEHAQSAKLLPAPSDAKQ